MTNRLQLLTAAIVALWGVIAIRLLFVQWWQHDEFAQQAEWQQRYVETIPARPGDILDRQGRLLATTVKTQSLYVDPTRIDDPSDIAEKFAEAINIDAGRLAERIGAHRDRKFLWVKRRLSDEEEQRVRELDLPPDVYGLRDEFRRRYPHRHLAAHVLGWRGIDGTGQAGIERSLDERLRGQNGTRTLVRDARGYVLDILEEVNRPPAHGRPLILSIDLNLQACVEENLDELMDRWQSTSASVIVLDPRCGEILAMASRPTFDPNAPADSPAANWTNHAVNDAFEPGSTFKPIIAAWALHRRVVDPQEEFDCGHGRYQMGRRLLHDAHPHGPLNLSGILVKSSNIGMAKIGERLGNAELFNAVQAFGFGRRTGVELPGESKGSIRPLAGWDDYSTGSIPMGQELAVTPLQIIRAHAALANGGRLLTPHLRRSQGDSAEMITNLVVTEVLDRDIADGITSGPLVEVVRSGTARRAALDGIRVFAKTGTAQIFDNQLGRYSDDRYVSSCICGAPANAPRAMVLVCVRDAQADGEPYGGTVAAPAAGVILHRALELTGTTDLARESGAAVR